MEDPRRGDWQRRWTPRLVAWAAVLVLLVVFVAENFEVVEVRLIFWRIETRLAWALLIAGLLGVAVGWLLPRLPFRRR